MTNEEKCQQCMSMSVNRDFDCSDCDIAWEQIESERGAVQRSADNYDDSEGDDESPN